MEVILLLKLAISGIDGTGKTQQIRLSGLGTNKATHRLERLTDYGYGWPALSETALHEWWFGQAKFDVLSRIIIEALNIRNASCVPSKINIFDRGTMMFKAVLAATFSTKNLGCIEDAYNQIDNLFVDLLDYVPDEHELLLVPDATYQQRIKPLIQIVNNRSCLFTPEQAARYTTYQEHLSHAIGHYYTTMPRNQKIIVNSCLLDVQNKIRSRADKVFDIHLPSICENLERCIALGGLSESGKSSIGEMLSNLYGFYRLKLRYFEDILIRYGHTIYADSMGFEIISFLHSHPHVTRASVESVHDPTLPAYLKLLFGDRFTSVFLKVPEELRISRTATNTGVSTEEATAKIREKDEIKQSTGAHRVEDNADLIFNNATDGIETISKEFAKQLGL